MVSNELVLKQQNSLGIITQVKLIDGRELQVVSKNKKNTQSYSVDILSLQERSKLILIIAWKWLIISAAFILLTLLLLEILPLYLTDNRNLYLGVVLITGLLGSVLSLTLFFKCSTKQQVFFSRNASVPIIKLSKGKPTKEIFSNFIESIENRIKEFQAHMEISEEKQLIGEMKMLRRLSDDGVISKESYELAKEKLFVGFDSQSINRNDTV